jgi:hypothetical protein
MMSRCLSSLGRALRALVILTVLFVAAEPALAKRGAPKPVSPVVVGSVEYSAPAECMGFVIATDTRTGKELWRRRIYSVLVNPLLERDVQDVFITSLEIDHGLLIVANERGQRFAVDLATRKVTSRK